MPSNQNHRDSQTGIDRHPQKWQMLPIGKFMPEDKDEFWYIIITKENDGCKILCGDDHDGEVFTLELVGVDQNSLHLHIFINSINKKNTYSLYLRNSTELRCVIHREEAWVAVDKRQMHGSIIIHYDNGDRDSESKIRLECKKDEFELLKLSIIDKITGARVRRRMATSTPGRINFSTGTYKQALKIKTSIKQLSPKLDQFVLSLIFDYKMRKVN